MTIKEEILKDIASTYFDNYLEDITSKTFNTFQKAEKYAKELWQLGKELVDHTDVICICKCWDNTFYIKGEEYTDYDECIVKKFK